MHSNSVVNLNCSPLLGKKGMVMHTEISVEHLLVSQKHSSAFKDNNQQDA